MQEIIPVLNRETDEKIQSIQGEIDALEKEIDRINRDIYSLISVRNNLGLFKGKEKQELSRQIESAKTEVAEKEKMVEEKKEEIAQEQKKQKNAFDQIQLEIRKLQRATRRKTMELRNASQGSLLTFGSYVQEAGGPEAIEWIVLAKEKGRMLLISQYGLDAKPYNVENTYVTWEACTLRQWLNDEFMQEVFSPEEQSLILKTRVSADKNPEYGTDPGNSTEDHLFLLSISEAKKYFDSDTARQCEPTEYAVKNGAYRNKDNGNCWWWLRSPGFDSDIAASVDVGGWVSCLGDSVDGDDGCVRPALWIDLES